jgi:hypothetical protein
VQAKPTRPKRPIREEALGPEFGAVVRQRVEGARTHATSFVGFQGNGNPVEGSPGWFMALMWGSELLGKMASQDSSFRCAKEPCSTDKRALPPPLKETS